MRIPVLVGSALGLSCLLQSAYATAGCSIHNDTDWSFVVTSGNTSNQQVGSHSQTAIAAGKIRGTSKEGKTIGGFCRDGDKLEITNDHGVPVLMPK
ncbi:MAG TPA: hypothetical protein VIV60_13565 [Polyangiaceae bacterium]